jgi:hypothetical protein
LQLTTEVIYLGLILDKGLTWKAQLTNVMNKSYRVFWTCKGTFGKAWALKPRVLHWIYTMVIRPVLTYGSTVWWPKVRYNVSRTELSKIQRSACLAITGAMKMTPTAAMGVLLGLPPLHVMIEAEAQSGIYRLMCNQQWKPKSTNSGHTKNLGIWSTNPSYRWGLTGCFRDMHTTSHSQSSSLTCVNSRMGSTQTTNGAWSGTQTGPRPIKALVLVCIDGA